MRSLGPRYLALWVGQTVSGFGTYIAFLTIPLVILHIQEATEMENTLDFSLAYALETAPTLVIGLVGGVLLDRWALRPVMVATDLLRACGFFYLAATVGEFGTTTVFVMAFVIGSLTTLFDGAMYSIIPAIVPEKRLPDANAYVAASQQIMFALGPFAAGALVLVFGVLELGLFINGVTFVVSAISLRWVGRVKHHRDPDDERSPFLTEAVNGIRYIWSEPRLRTTTIASAIPNFVIGFIEATFVVLAIWVLQADGEFQIGVLLLAMGTGGVVGALIAPRITRAVGLGRTFIFGMALSGICLFLVMFTTYGPIALALMVAWMIGISLINIPLVTIRQHYAATSMLGRVISASRALGWATLPIGALVGGWLGATPDTYPMVARAFPVVLIATAIWLTTTVIRTDTYGPDMTPQDAETVEGERTVSS